MASARRHLLAVVVFSFFVNILMLLVPMYLLQLYDRVLPSRNVDTLLFLTAIVISGLLVMTLLDAIRGLILVKFGAWFDDQVAGHLLSGTLARSLRRQRVSSSNIFNDLATVRGFFSGSSLFPLLDAPWTPVFLGILFMLHPIIGTLTLVGAVLLFLLAILTEGITRYHVGKAQTAAGHLSDTTRTLVRNADVVESMGMRSQVLGNWSQHNRQALDAHRAAGVRSVWAGSASRFLRHVLQVAVIGSAAWLVLQHELTAGALIASMLLMRRALAPFDRAVVSWKSMLAARRAYGRINKRLDESPSLHPATVLPAPSGSLDVQKVSYRHRGRKSRTLRDITLSVRPGEVIGLVGPTAAGKSTLAKLIVGVLQPSSGSVLWGQTDLHQWDPGTLGPFVGYLPQDLELFTGTVAENIARMNADDMEAVIAAARLTGADRIIEAMPHGYETAVGEGGAYLSGGQQRLIGLTRAVYGDARLIVLDEPDANLDSYGRRSLKKTIERLKARNAMVILISHQTSNLDHVDRFLLMKEGRLKLATVGDKDAPRDARDQRPEAG